MSARRTTARYACLIAAALPLALAACAAKSTPTATTPAAPASPSGQAAAAGQTGTPRCTGQHAKVSLVLQNNQATSNTSAALLQVTNTGDKACTVEGWATVTLTDAADETVKVPTRTVDQPGPATLITLQPGSTASAGVKWTTCAKSSADCAAGNGLKAYLPKDSTAVTADLTRFPDPAKNAITMKELQIGTLQASAQGVVAW